MPARRRRKALRLKKTKPNKKIIYFFLFSFCLLVFLFTALKPKNWNGEDKVSLVIKNSDQSISVVVFDPLLKEIYNIRIDPNTEIEVAGEYGKWKIKSIWQLGEQEGMGGELLSRSITLGLRMPVYLWADNVASGLVEPLSSNLLSSFFSRYKSNLSLGDKFKFLVFSLKVKNTNRVNINLENTSYLERKVLISGDEGFIVAQNPPESISAIFADPALSSKIFRVAIKDGSEKPGLAEELGKVIEVLGGKVSSIEKIQKLDGTCMLESNEVAALRTLEKIFDCETTRSEVGNFDLEVSLGKDFAKMY